MKKLHAFWREHSLFLRYLGGLILFALLLICLIAGTMFYSSQRTIREQLKAAESHYLRSVSESFSNYLSLARQTANSLAINGFVKQAILSGNSSWSDLLYNCSLAVKQGLSSDPCIASICLIAGDEILIKSERDYHDHKYDLQMVDMMVWNSNELMIPWRMTSPRKSHQYVSIIQPIDVFAPPNHIGGVLVTLDMEKIAQRVFADSAGLFYVLDRQGRVMLSNDSSAFLCTEKEVPLLREALAGKDASTISHTCYVISSTSLDTLTLYHFTPYQQFYGLLQRYGIMVILVLLVCAALAVPLSLLLARRAYRPVKNVFIQLVSRLEPSAEEPAPQGELQQISSAIVHIYETIDAYREDINASALRACLTNGLRQEGDSPRLLAYLNNLPCHRLVMLGVPEAPTCVQNATDIVSGYLSGAYQTTSVSTSDNTITLVLSDSVPIEESPVLQLLENSIISLNQVIAQPVLFAISPCVTDIAGLHEAYIAAANRLSTSALYARSGCIRAVSAQPPSGGLSEETCGYALRQDHMGFLSALEDLCIQFQSLTTESVFEQLALLSVRISQRQSVLPLHSADALPLFSREYRRLRVIRSHTALIAYFTDVFLANTAPAPGTQEKELALVKLSSTYIGQHFSQRDLSAQEVADALNISVSHFSRLLKKHTGKTFLELVTACRMEKASQMLVDSPDTSINVLGQSCGFSSPSYFTASFKKWFGMTPSEYRLRAISEKAREQ